VKVIHGFMRSLFLAVLLLAAFAAGAAIASAPRSRAAIEVTQAPTAAPQQAETAAPQTQAATPAVQATPEYRFVYTPTPSPQSTPFPGPHAPQINEIDLNDQTLVTPGRLRVRVLTNYEVSTVVAKTMGYELSIPKQRSGIFAAEYDVPQSPAFLSNQTFNVDFVATVPDGRNTTVTLPLSLR
jgi:hypothetical protein